MWATIGSWDWLHPMKFELQRVQFMPKDLQPGILYLSEEFGIAIHLCACGCGSKIRTPLGPTEWAVQGTDLEPTLYPSIGNWQLPCRSHYWITDGEAVWAPQWSDAQVAAGRRGEESRRRHYFDRAGRTEGSAKGGLWAWIKKCFSIFRR